jgi:hypothetical protein
MISGANSAGQRPCTWRSCLNTDGSVEDTRADKRSRVEILIRPDCLSLSYQALRNSSEIASA